MSFSDVQSEFLFLNQSESKTLDHFFFSWRLSKVIRFDTYVWLISRNYLCSHDSYWNFRDASADSGEAAESEPVTEEVADPASDEAPAEPSAPVEESVNDEPASEPITETEVATTEEAAVETPAEDAPVEEAATVESTETAEEPPTEEATEVAADETSAEPAAEVSLLWKSITITLNKSPTQKWGTTK